MKAKENKHLLFAKYIVDGLTQSDAYRKAYPHSQRWASNAVNTKSSELANKGEVKVMIADLREQALKQFMWSKETSLKILGSIALNKSAKNLERISAVKEINVMYGYNSPSKVDVTSSDGSMSPKKDLSKDELEDSLKKYGIKVDK
jgi:hypothetical protein